MRNLTLLSLLAALAAPALAFGPQGHMTVGGIADQLLAGTPTGKQVRAILGSNLQTASVWADCVKSVEQKQAGAPLAYADTPGKYAECDYYENKDSIAAMVAFVKRNAKACYDNSSDEQCRHKAYHYTDVSTFQTRYAKGLVGTSDHDIVSAIDACVAVLKGGASPPPFDIRGRKEALRLLAHYLGDLHQPLHVSSVYLDKKGKPVNPDQGAYDPKSGTKGGNLISTGFMKLHGDWDSIPGSLAMKLLAGEGAAAARLVPASKGSVDGWPEAWATDTINSAGLPALSVLRFGPRAPTGGWVATVPASYRKDREALQRQQIVKGGARLAELLKAALN